MASHFRVHSVDLLGNGMSGMLPEAAPSIPAPIIAPVLRMHSTSNQLLAFACSHHAGALLYCSVSPSAAGCSHPPRAQARADPQHPVLWAQTYPTLAQQPSAYTAVHPAAGRPTFRAEKREDAEAFFLTALSRWREAMGIDKMVLVGHSLGGYLAATYALQHPQHVQHLLLVCPAGIVGPWRCGGSACLPDVTLMFLVTRNWELVAALNRHASTARPHVAHGGVPSLAKPRPEACVPATEAPNRWGPSH